MSGKSKVVPGGDLAKVMRACCMISNSTATLAVFSCGVWSQLRCDILTESEFALGCWTQRVLTSHTILTLTWAVWTMRAVWTWQEGPRYALLSKMATDWVVGRFFRHPKQWKDVGYVGWQQEAKLPRYGDYIYIKRRKQYVYVCIALILYIIYNNIY